ncbi:protein of unknown function [Nocardia cyriacigeorgica GUH-2]|uniref:Uncharacterized protein n=1 Tax=Nocardia cyriacigeorgica (strain GUH-2) TaxID=1127134 RepID=H6R988_NOCCG|nr:protein of unknown function [Nocardia cyriacigeorgica GUH-2]
MFDTAVLTWGRTAGTYGRSSPPKSGHTRGTTARTALCANQFRPRLQPSRLERDDRVWPPGPPRAIDTRAISRTRSMVPRRSIRSRFALAMGSKLRTTQPQCTSPGHRAELLEPLPEPQSPVADLCQGMDLWDSYDLSPRQILQVPTQIRTASAAFGTQKGKVYAKETNAVRTIPRQIVLAEHRHDRRAIITDLAIQVRAGARNWTPAIAPAVDATAIATPRTWTAGPHELHESAPVHPQRHDRGYQPMSSGHMSPPCDADVARANTAPRSICRSPTRSAIVEFDVTSSWRIRTRSRTIRTRCPSIRT